MSFERPQRQRPVRPVETPVIQTSRFSPNEELRSFLATSEGQRIIQVLSSRQRPTSEPFADCFIIREAS